LKKIIHLGVSTVLLVLAGIGLNGCAGDYAPVQIGKNVYTLQRITRMATYHDASEYCRDMGLVMKVLNERKNNKNKEDDLYNTVIDYKCLNPNSEEYGRYAKYGVDSDVSIKVDKKVKYE